MPVYTEQFAREKFNKEEQWIRDNLVLESIMGSHAYACNNKDSDYDVVGLVMDKHLHLYPQAYGYVLGFDQLPNFDYKHCKKDNNGRIIIESTGREVEAEWASLTRFFYLAGVKGSPNLIETLFVRRALVTFGHKVGWMLRDNRKLFLSMRTFHAFKGYAFQQLARMRRAVKSGKAETPERQAYLDTYGMDIKMAYHCLRLLDQLHQLLTEQDMDLTRNKEECKTMRKGDWGDWNKFETHVNDRLELLEKQAIEGKGLAPKPQSGALQKLLKECLEEWYGSETQLQKQGTEYVSAKMVFDKLESLDNKLNILKKVHLIG